MRRDEQNDGRNLDPRAKTLAQELANAQWKHDLPWQIKYCPCSIGIFESATVSKLLSLINLIYLYDVYMNHLTYVNYPLTS